MQKKFQIGIDLRRSLEGEKFLIDKYKDYLDSIYVDIPFYTSKGNTYICNFNLLKNIPDKNQYILDTKEIIKYARERGIKICLTINKERLSEDEIRESFDFIREAAPEQICARTEYAKIYKTEFPNITYVKSRFDVEKYQEQDEDLFDIFSIRNTHPWKFGNIIEGHENRVYVNMACPTNCPGCLFEDKHDSFLEPEFTDVETWAAHHIFFARDIDILEHMYPNTKFTFEVSTRIWGPGFNTKRVDKYLEHVLIDKDYTKLLDDEMFSKCILYTALWDKVLCNYRMRDFDIEKFKKLKVEWWQKINPVVTEY